MDFLLDALTNWLKEMLVGGIMGNLTGMFDSVNQQVADIATQVGQTPQGWNGSIFSMIQNLSNSIMVPIAGVILAIVMTLELIQMITDRNNLHDVDTWMIFKWVFKSAAAILLVTNTWNLVMAVFDMAQSVVAQASGIIGSDASIDISAVMTDMESRLMDMDLGPLFGLWFQSLFIGITMWALYICIFIVIYGRMIEIYLVTSVAPIPMATMMGKEWGGMGQNYLRSLLALGFQAFLIIVCVAIYAVLVQNIATEDDIIMAIWTCVGYTVLLCFTLFKTGSAGHIYLDGIDVTEINEKEIARFRRENLGFVFQDFNLLDTLTISENIALALTINKVPAGEIDGRVWEMAGKLNITDILDKYPYQVSGGQKQRCACARAIINQPKLILADEPTGALDSHSSQMLLSTIRSINETLGATILMVTHDAFSASYANRILFLRDGAIFTEILKGSDSRRIFFEKTLDVLTMMGGGVSDVR